MSAATSDQAARCAAGGMGSGFARFMPARSSAEPAPHFEITLTARVKGTSTGCTRALSMM